MYEIIRTRIERIFGIVQRKLHLAGQYQFIRFVLVGGINTLVGYVLFLAVSILGFAYPVTIFISMTLGVVFNFISTGHIVFANKNISRFFRFAVVYLLIYLLNIGLTKVLFSFQIKLYVIQAVLAIPLAGITFFLQKYLVFKKKRVADDSKSSHEVSISED